MKIKFSAVPSLGSLFVLSLSACIIATAFPFDSIVHDFQNNRIARSLQESPDITPTEASIFSAPGPVIPQSLPAAASNTPEAAASTPTDSPSESADRYSVGRESTRPMAAIDDSGDMDEAQTHIPTVSEVRAMTAVHDSGSAIPEIAHVLMVLVASTSLFLHLS
ncbi:hypothetical protein BDV18DRAFT_3950 [Aspergillus unguis]